MKIKVDRVSNDDIKVYHTGKFQDFTARYIVICYSSIVCAGSSKRKLILVQTEGPVANLKTSIPSKKQTPEKLLHDIPFIPNPQLLKLVHNIKQVHVLVKWVLTSFFMHGKFIDVT